MVRRRVRQHSQVDSAVSSVFLYGAPDGSRAAVAEPITPGRHRQVGGLSQIVSVCARKRSDRSTLSELFFFSFLFFLKKLKTKRIS